MNLIEAEMIIKQFRDTVTSTIPEMTFKYGSPRRLPTDDYYRNNFREDVPEEFSKASGVYFVLDESDYIQYIGKATTDNLWKEICNKFSSPIIVNNEPRFEKSSLAQYAPKDNVELRNNIIEGKFKIAVVTIEPNEYSSLVEVYIQTYHHRKHDGKLPQLNKRIG
jgi:hypothetical protein